MAIVQLSSWDLGGTDIREGGFRISDEQPTLLLRSSPTPQSFCGKCVTACFVLFLHVSAACLMYI